MIDLEKAKSAFKEYLNSYDNQNESGFKLKVDHTYHVVENARMISENLKLSEEDIQLASLVGLLHDIGRFTELKSNKKFSSLKEDHATIATKVLFEDGFINKFVDTNEYNNIIKKAIENHNKKEIEEGLNERELLHAKIIRDADKLDNFEELKTENIKNRFPGLFNNIEEFENSAISDKVFNSIKNNECVDIKDRVYPLDYWICVLAFVFDISFPETLSIIKNKDYINIFIDRFEYKQSQEKMNEIRQIINSYIDNRLKEKE